MLPNIVLVLSLIGPSYVLANPHQTIRVVQNDLSTSSNYNIPDPSSSSSSSTSTIQATTSTGSTSITRTVTVSTTGIAGATSTEIKDPTTIDTIGDASTSTSTWSDSGNGNGAFTTTEGGISTSTSTPPAYASMLTTDMVSEVQTTSSCLEQPKSSTNSPPAVSPCTSSTDYNQHYTKTMSDANTVETMTIGAGKRKVLVYFVENQLEEVEYVEVRFSTWYKSPGIAHRPTNI
jgi:hypothetical protein